MRSTEYIPAMKETVPARSYTHGPGPEPLLGLTVGEVLDGAAQRWPDGLALAASHQDQELQRRRRRRNIALAAALGAFVVVVYLVSIVRMGGG